MGYGVSQSVSQWGRIPPSTAGGGFLVFFVARFVVVVVVVIVAPLICFAMLRYERSK